MRQNVRLAVYHWADRPLLAWRAFQAMPCPDGVTFNTALAACPAHTTELLAALRAARLALDGVGANAALEAFATCATWRSACDLLRHMAQQRLPQEPATCSSLVKACQRANQWPRAPKQHTSRPINS